MLNPGQLPESSCLSRDEKTLFVGARKSSTVVAVDAHRMAVRGSLQVSGDPLRVYTISDDQLLLTDITNRALHVLSTGLRPIATITLDGIPAAVSLHPRKPLSYVSLVDTNRIAVVDLDRRAVVGGFGTQLEPDSSVLLSG
ncbi:MAG: YncE family protein [Pseudonocardiaceae bacterium]